MASLKELYTALKADGAPLPDTYEKFSNYMTSGPQDGYAHRKEVYDALKADGAPLPDTYEEFSRALFSTNVGINASSDSASARTGRDEGAETVQSFRLRRGGKDFSIPVEEVNAAGGLQGWAKAHPGAPVRVYMQGKNDDGSDFKGHVDLSQAHERNKTKGYKYQTVEAERFKPTELEKKRMSANLYRSMQQHNAAMQDIRTRQEDVMEYASKGNGMNFRQAVKSKPQMNAETGEMEDTWLTPEGKRTTSKAVADLESFNYRMATDMSVGSQLRRANERLADIEKRLDERGKELMAEHEKSKAGGVLGALVKAWQNVGPDGMVSMPDGDTESMPEFAGDKEYQALRLAARKAREEIQKLNNAKEREDNGERFWHDFGRATGQALFNKDAWDFGKGAFRDAATMMQLNKAVESGRELSQAENDALTELYLHDNVMNQYGDLGRGDRWGDIAGTSLSFMKDFVLTGGGFSAVGTKLPTLLTKKVAFNVAKKMGTDMAGKKLALEIAENGVLNYIRKGGKGAIGRILQSQGKAGLAATMATKAVGVGAEDLLIRAPLMAATIQGQSTAAKIIDTKLGPVAVDEKSGELHFANDKGWGAAAWQAGADQVIENYSEMWGAHVPAMSDVSKFFGARNLTAAVLRATRENAGTVLSKTNKFLTRAGVNGYLGEVGEEYYGQLWRTMLDLDSAKDSEGNNLLGSGQFHGDIWGGMALSIGMTSAGTVAGSYGVQGAQKGVSSAVYLHQKKNMQRSAKRAATVFDADEWESLQQLIDTQENATMGAFAETVLADPDMTQQQKDAAMDYMEKAMTFRGYNLGEMLRGKAGENNPDEQELSQSYMDGYEGTSIQEMVDAANMYQLQHQKLMEAFDGMDEENLSRIMNDIHNDPIAAINKTGEELRPLMLDYANALMVYQGMEQRFNDDMESRIAQAEWEADANTNRQTGQIQPGVMETDDRQVYVVNGRVALLDNGDIDTADSDDTIIIRDAETGRLEFANPKDLSSMGDAQDPVALKEQQGAAIRQQMEQEHSDKMSGRLSLEAGSVVSVPGGDGMVNATITGPAVDEQGRPVEAAVTVQSEDGSVETYSVEDLQAWADEANRQRVLDFEDERVAQRSAETASHSEDENASQPVMAMPPFALNDEFTILNPETGEPIHGEVTGELDEDGTVEIYTNMPMNGSLVNRIRPEDLTGMIYTYNGERLEDMQAELTSASDSEQMESQGHTEVYSIPAVGSGKGTDTTEVISGQSKGATAPAGNSSETSDGKVNNSVSEKQENQGESSDSEPTPLQRLPRNEQGEPAFEQAETPELGWDALVEYSEGDSQMAQDVADAMMEGKRKELEKVRKQKPKGKTVPELIASRKKIAAELAQAELEYKQWQDMANVERVRQAAIQAEQEAAEREAAELAAAEEAERKALEKADKRFGEVYDKVKGNALAVERLRQLEPETIYEAASVVLSRGKILWDNKGGSRGFKQETGYGEGERKKMFSMFATKENGGRSLRRLAEDEMQETCSLAGIPYDNVDAFNALTEVISEAQLPSDIRNYIKNRRIEQALEIYDQKQAAERAAYEEWSYQNFHMSADEYEAYEEQREGEIRIALKNFDEKEYFSNIADELIEREENERRGSEETVTQGESTDHGGGVEVLSTQGTDTQGGRSADAERQGVRERNGYQVDDTSGAVPEGASGGEGVKNNQTRFDRSIPATPEAQRSAIERILDFAKRVKDRVERAVIGGITERQAQDLAQQGIDVDETWVHSFESSAVNHNQKQHGDQRTEDTRGQIAITAEDYDKIPEILDGYDRVSKSSNTTHRSGNEVLIYEKEFDDGYVYYLEEKRDNRKSLAFQTMYKKKKGTDSSDGLMQNASTSTPIATPDNLDSQSESKGNTLLSDKQEVEGESSGNGAKASPLNRRAQRKDEDASETIQSAVEAASAQVNTEPTEAQKKAGNYKKGHVTIGEFDITIENPAGSVRKGVDANGKEWHTTMANAYGYIKGTEGVDGDHIDVFLHSDMNQWNGRKVYVVDQTNTDGSFDEHKVMLGFNDKDVAMSAYLANYDGTWADTHPGLRISETSIEDFDKWVQSSHRKTKPFAVYSTVSKVVDNAPVRSVHAQDNNKEIIGRSFSPEESERFLNYMEETADVAPEIELTPANWTKEFGAHGIINTPIGDVKQGDNQYFKLAQQGRNGKLGMIRPTLEHPCVIIEDERAPQDGRNERSSSYIFIKTFAKKDGTRYYHFASITVSKEGKEVVISSQERSANRISKLLQQGKVAWINKEFSLHPMPQIEESVPLNDSNGPTPTDSQSAMLGISSSELDVSSERKVNNSASEKQESQGESLNGEAMASPLNGTAPHGDKGNAKGKKAPRAADGNEKDKTGRIEDFGEKILGARKDALREFAQTVDNVTVQSLIELPLSKAFKRPNLKKLSESGALSDEDACLAEAVLQTMVCGKKKPALTRRTQSKRDIADWAQETYEGIRMLGDILSGDETRRDAALQRHAERLEQERAKTNAHAAKLREWNPGKHFSDITEMPDPVKALRIVLENIGYRAGDKVNLPLTRVSLTAGLKYEVSSPGKQGAYWFQTRYDTLQEAIDTMTLAAKLARGDRDVTVPERQFGVRGVGMRHQELTGRYAVTYWSKNQKHLNERIFDSETEAKDFAEKNQGRIDPEKRYVNEYDSYRIRVVNPLTGEAHQIGAEFAKAEEAASWLIQHPEEATALALDEIYKEMGTASAPRAHFYVTGHYDRKNQRMMYSVVKDEKDDPWPFVKDFDSRQEAEAWLKENLERLESERKAAKEQERKIVYFDTTESPRRGTDRRNGKDATPAMFMEQFGFRGVQFGNWTNDADRQAALNQAYDAFMDMAEALGISTRAMSLDGELGLAFGARGSGSALAHYEPMNVVINLTKTRGAGSLAHEWWHALDNFLARRGGVPMGYVASRNGLDNLRPEVADAINALMNAVVNTDYLRRSCARGDYWGRPTEVMARLFAEWINVRLAEDGNSNAFLSRGVKPGVMSMYQQLNYLAYRADELRRAERENRASQVMPFEEFKKDPRSLRGFPYPTPEEIAGFSPRLEEFFDALAQREKETGSIAQEPGSRYGTTGTEAPVARESLFDWADREERERKAKMEAEPQRDETDIAGEQADAQIDEYAETFKNYLDRMEEIERRIAELEKEDPESAEIEALRQEMSEAEEYVLDCRAALQQALTEYYALHNTQEDAKRIARDFVFKVQAEVSTAVNRSNILQEVVERSRDVQLSPEAVETTQGEARTGGGYISYDALGHLPNPAAGEFSYVERQFSRTGEFSFTGNEVVRDRGDVAYMFRALESYAIEHVFAAFVKDGRVKVLHIGMGGPTSSVADLGAIRAGYEAFGADKIYLVHNHPSGTLNASGPDLNLMKHLEMAFDGVDVETEGIIIDTTSGRYLAFNGEGRVPGSYDSVREDGMPASERTALERPQTGGSTRAEVVRFDHNEQTSSGKAKTELVYIHDAKTVDDFITRMRFGDESKVSYLVLSNRNEIIGNFHTGFENLDDKALAEEMTSVATKYAGTRVIVYGNTRLEGTQIGKLQKRVSALSMGSLQLLDVMGMIGPVRTSAHDNGLMEAEAEYGGVSEPMNGVERTQAKVEIEETNQRFNEELERQESGTLPERHIYQLGMPGAILHSTGVPNLPIQMSATRLQDKATNFGHNFNLTEIRDLVKELQRPMAVFSYGDKGKMQNIIIGIESKGKQFIVGLSLNPVVNGKALEINSVRNVFPKNNAEWLNWISKDKLLYADKEKIQALIDKQRTILADVSYLDLEDVAKKVKNFENPKLPEDFNEDFNEIGINYQVPELELLISGSEASDALSNSNRITVAKLLKGVEKSYDSGKKLLDGSERTGAEAPSQDQDATSEAGYESEDTQYRMGRDRFSAERRAEDERQTQERKAAHIRGLAEKLHLDNVEVVTDTATLEGKKATAKGFYNKRTGKITIVLPNNLSTIDAEQTLLHEAVAHYGLRQLFGDRFDTFLDNVFESAEPEIRRKIASMARENGWNIRTATEEYLAGLAEDTDFEKAQERAGWWGRIKQLFIDMVEKLGFRGFRDSEGTVLTDNELRYILWRSYENLKENGRRGVMGEAADIAKQAELQVGNYVEGGIEAEYATMPGDTRSTEAISDKIEESFNAAVAGELKGKPVEVGVLTDAGREYLEKLSGVKMKERVSFVLNPSDLVHVYRNHFGSNEKDKGNNIPLTTEDIRAIADVVANPERIIFGKEPDGLKRNLFYFLAPAKEGTYNLLEIYGDRKGNLTAKTFYKTKKGVSQRALSLKKSEHLTSVTDGSTLSDAKLPIFFENPTIEEEELFRPGDFTPRDKVLARDQYEKMVSSSRYQFTEAMQDSMLGLKELYRAILGQGKDFRIEDVAGFENAYLYENAMSSRNNSHAHRYFLSYMQLLLKEIGKICGANEQKRRDLMDYMMAKHGLERNEYMRNEAINNGEDADRDFAGLTGLTKEKDWQTAEAVAQQWVDDYEAKTDTTALWKAINNATKATLWTVYQSGMISKETHDKIAGVYAYYIPLRGWDETTSDEVYGYLTSNDGPLNGSIMKSAEGRGSKADDPIATIAKMADDAIRQGNRNVMKQRFLNFVLNHSSDLVSVHDLWLEYDDVTDEWIPVFADINDTDTPLEVEQKIEAFEQRMEALKQKDPKKYKRGREANGIPYKVVKGNLREHQVLVKRGGQTMVLTINGNPRAAQAINGLTNPDVGDAGLAEPIFKFMEAVNRQLSAFYTTRNPAFTLSNFIRDMQYANCTMWVKEDARYAKRFHMNCLRFNPQKMGVLLRKWENGTLNPKVKEEMMFEQFMLNGGETGYTNVKDIERYKRTVAAELKKQGSTARQKWAAVGMAFDLVNRSIENCARFAAFVTSREHGRNIDRAIYDAKEVSVNFNKKGSGAKFAKAKGQTLTGKSAAWLSGWGRALWVFWGAGIQGMTNFGRLARRHPGKFARRVLMRLFLLGVAVPLLNMLFNMLFGDDGDDDKKAYYNLPEYTRRSNICLCFGRTSLTIPLPVEARAIYGLGELAFGAISGNERYSNKELAYQTAAQVSQVLPLDMLEGGGGFQALTPSAFKPIFEPYWYNSSYTGMPIYRDTPFNQEDPEWTKAYASTDKHFVGASKWLNEVSGGDDFKKGAIDINPAKLEYMLRGFFGGLFSIPMEGKKTAETIFGDREFEWRSIPILNRVFKSGDERTANRKIRDEYFKYQDEYKSTGRLVRKYENATDEGVLGYAEKLNFLYNSPEYARWLVFDDFKADMDAYKEMMSDETDPAKQKQIKAEMETEMRELVNALHNPDKYLESIYGKGGYPGIAEEETETE